MGYMHVCGAHNRYAEASCQAFVKAPLESAEQMIGFVNSAGAAASCNSHRELMVRALAAGRPWLISTALRLPAAVDRERRMEAAHDAAAAQRHLDQQKKAREESTVIWTAVMMASNGG